MTTEQKIITTKAGVLELTEQLTNVARAYRSRTRAVIGGDAALPKIS
jgi:hypothetical protein